MQITTVKCRTARAETKIKQYNQPQTGAPFTTKEHKGKNLLYMYVLHQQCCYCMCIDSNAIYLFVIAIYITDI